jgi:hypothetical protein
MMKWIALLSMFACSSTFAQTPPPDPTAVIRAQIMQHWFSAPQVKLDFSVSFDLVETVGLSVNRWSPQKALTKETPLKA